MSCSCAVYIQVLRKQHMFCALQQSHATCHGLAAFSSRPAFHLAYSATHLHRCKDSGAVLEIWLHTMPRRLAYNLFDGIIKSYCSK